MSHAPESQDPDDRRITSRELDGRGYWLNPDKQVSYGHLLHAVAVLRWSPAAVVSRLTALGYTDIQHAEVPVPDTVDLDDIPLIRDVSAQYGPTWLDIGKPVSLHQILASARLADRGPADVARRLTALGYRLGGDGRPLPESPNPGDPVLINAGIHYGKLLDWGDEVPASHVLNAAGHLRCSPYAAATRLIALGLRLPYTPDPEDDRILKSSGEYGARWFYGAPPAGHILAVAQETGRRPADIVARLTELGYGQPVVPDPPEADDLTILSEELDGRSPWLVKNTVVGLQLRHILRAALATGRSPADIAERLTELGHWLHENAKLPAAADEADIRLLETVDRSFLDNVHLEHVLRSASLTGRSPADVASRLTAFGYRLPDDVDYPDVRGSLASVC